MKSFVALSLAVGAYASCCTFDLTASGGKSGTVGRLSDGQLRIGGGLPQTNFTICANGTVTDAAGYGCILTPEVEQFQCDLNQSPMSGFSIIGNGTFEYSGSSVFYACPASDTEWNIYTTPVVGQAKCVEISLAASGCAAKTSTCSSGAASTITSTETYTITEASEGSTVTEFATVTQEATTTEFATVTEGGATVTEASTITEYATITGEAQTVTQYATATEGTEIVTQFATITREAKTVTQFATITEEASTTEFATITASVTITECEATSIPVSTPQTETTAPVSIPVSTPVSTSVEESTTYVESTSLIFTPSSTPQVPESTTSTEIVSTVMSTSSIPVSTAPTTLYTSTQTSSYIWVNSSTTAPTSTTSSASTCVSTALTGTYTAGNYQYPHLIVPISSTSPDTAYGTQYFGTISSNVSTIFNFDIPESYAGDTCSLIFLLPLQSELETSSYEFSGTGEVEFEQLSSAATTTITYDNAPSVSSDLGDFTLTEGSSTLVSTFACQAGETVSYEIKAVGDTYLYFFQDYNPSPLGLYITYC